MTKKQNNNHLTNVAKWRLRQYISAARMKAAKFLLEEIEQGGLDYLFDNVKTGTPAIRQQALELITAIAIPKLRPENAESISDLPEETKQALKGLKDIPIEKQPAKIIELYSNGDIDGEMAKIYCELIKASQNIYDERLAAVLSELQARKE